MTEPNSRAGWARPPADPDGDEFAVIGRLAARLPPAPPGETWIGDDAAVVAPPAGPLLLATDLTVAGVHADLALVGLDDLGWRSVATAVSDVAAMGGAPGQVLVAVAAPPGTDLDRLGAGVAEAAAAHACHLVGGDLSTADQVVVAVAVTGTVADGPPPVIRGGARPGDRLFVTGPLGAAAAGLRVLRSGGDGPLADRYRRPRARLAEGATARRAGASAMIDVSDGFAADVVHLAEASDVGLRLEEPPTADGATPAEALGGGDDYELILATADPDGLVAAFAAAGLGPPLAVGWCVEAAAGRWIGDRPLEPVGWRHRFG